MHSPIENAAAIFAAAKHPKSLFLLDDAEHLVSRKDDAEYAATVLAAWASRYIAALVVSDDAGTPSAEGEVVVSETGENPFAQAISAGVHSLRADELLKIGGGNTGLMPYDLLLSGLRACTSMTIRMYANRKKWPLEKAVVRLKHDKIHAEDCADCETKDGRVDRIERTIELTGDLDDEQRTRLLEIVDKCPVHRTLENEVKVEARLAE